MNINSDITFYNVFYVTDDQAPNAYPSVAIRPHIYSTENGEKKVEWENISRGVRVTCTKVNYVNNLNQELVDSSHPPKEINLNLEIGKVLTLRLLTCEIYNNKIQNRGNKFNSEEELQSFYLNYDPSQYI